MATVDSNVECDGFCSTVGICDAPVSTCIVQRGIHHLQAGHGGLALGFVAQAIGGDRLGHVDSIGLQIKRLRG